MNAFPTSTDATKACRDCRDEFPIETFARNVGYRDGRLPRCPDCQADAVIAHRERRLLAPMTPLRYYLDTRGRYRCLRCDGQAYGGEDGEISCMMCGEYLNPPRRKLLSVVPE